MLGLACQRPEDTPEGTEGLVDGTCLRPTLSFDLAAVQPFADGEEVGGKSGRCVTRPEWRYDNSTEWPITSLSSKYHRRYSPSREVDHVERSRQAGAARVLPDNGELENAVAAGAVLIHGSALGGPEKGIKALMGIFIYRLRPIPYDYRIPTA